MKPIHINRKTYENIKRFDHTEMDVYIKKIQQKAYEEGYAQATSQRSTVAAFLKMLNDKRIKGVADTLLSRLTRYAESHNFITEKEAAELYDKEYK